MGRGTRGPETGNRNAVEKAINVRAHLPPHVVILDDYDDDDGICDGRDQEQRHVEADQHDAPGLGEFHLRRRELGDQLLDDRRLSHARRVLRPQADAAVPCRRVVEHDSVCRQRGVNVVVSRRIIVVRPAT